MNYHIKREGFMAINPNNIPLPGHHAEAAANIQLAGHRQVGDQTPAVAVQLPDQQAVAKQMKENKALSALKTVGRIFGGTAMILGLIALSPVTQVLYLVIGGYLTPFGGKINNFIKNTTGLEIQDGSIGLANAFQNAYFTAFFTVGSWMKGTKNTKMSTRITSGLPNGVANGGVSITPISKFNVPNIHIKEKDDDIDEDDPLHPN